MSEGLCWGQQGVCLSVNVCAGGSLVLLDTHPSPAMERSGTYTPMEGQKWQGLHVCSKPPEIPVFSLPLAVCCFAAEQTKERKGDGRGN